MTFSGGLPGLVALVRGWTARQGGETSVTMVIDGDRLEVPATSAEERSEHVAAFLARHG